MVEAAGVEGTLDAMGPVLARWTMGGSALPAAPAGWRAALGNEAGEAELRLLALAGQFLGTAVIAEPAGEIAVAPDLPRLALPPLPDPLRARAKRVLAQLRSGESRRDLLDFLEGRGRTLHPGDWLPGPGDAVPAVYAPWQDWVTARAVRVDEDGIEDLAALGPAARRVALAALRARDPAAARAAIATQLAVGGADARLTLVETLGVGLSADDRPLLENLATDRAPRVKALAASLLARLGGGGYEAEAAELAAFFPVRTKGILRRTRAVAIEPVKTPAQGRRRAALMAEVPFAVFAQALGMAPLELVEAWPWRADTAADHGLATMAARSADDAAVARIADAVAEPAILAPLVPRLSPVGRHRAGLRLLQSGATFGQTLGVAGGSAGIDGAIRTPAGTALLANLTKADARPADATEELTALGLLASREGAREALARCGVAGLVAADPRLDMLRLNAALDEDPR